MSIVLWLMGAALCTIMAYYYGPIWILGGALMGLICGPLIATELHHYKHKRRP